MTVRQVQVRGCLPTLLALIVIGALVAAAMTASLAFLAVAVVAAVVAAIVRRVRRIVGGAGATQTAPRRRASDATIDGEVIEPPGGDRPPRRLE